MLRRTLFEEAARERGTTARVLALIAELDSRRLYLPAGYPSTYVYCVRELGYSEDAAYKRIQAARAACRVPGLLAAVAEGRLHLTGVGMLAPHLTPENAAELIEASTHKTKGEIEELLARRFPRPDLAAMVVAIPDRASRPDSQLAPAQVEGTLAGPAGREKAHASPEVDGQPPAPAGLSIPQPCPATVRPPRLAPIAPERFALQLTISRSTHEKLRHAQALLSHNVPSGDLATVLDLALDVLVERLEKRKFAKTEKPRPQRCRTSNANPHRVPAHVKRAVWERDGGRCTFVGENDRRCNARKFLEYDHVKPVARGGQPTVAGIRLRCRMHNQYEAEQVFGAGFMQEKRRGIRTTRSTRGEPRREP